MNHMRHTAFSHLSRLFLAGGLLMGLAACETQTSDRDLRPVGPQEAVNLAVPRSDGAFGSMTNPIWIDPRVKEAFEAAHIAGAVSMPFGSGMFEDKARDPQWSCGRRFRRMPAGRSMSDHDYPPTP